MLINGIDVEALPGVILMSFEKQPREMISYDEWLTGALSPISTMPSQWRYSRLTLKFLVDAPTISELEKRESELQAMLMKGTLKEDDSEYFFAFQYASGTKKKINLLADEITYTLNNPYKYMAEKAITLAKQTEQAILVSGNVDTPCIYEIKALTSIIDFDINGIKVHNLPINSLLVIDGRKCTITLDGINKFKDAEIHEFPYLHAGDNTIKINNINCTIKVKYEPRFV